MTTTTPTSGAADLLDLIEAYAEARHRQGHSSYNAQTAAALQAVKDALAAGQATAAQQEAAYAALPEPDIAVGNDGRARIYTCKDIVGEPYYTAGQLRDFADATHALRTEQPAPADRIDLHQALTDPENQPNQYGVEFGMSGTHMHFKIGNQLFKLAYEPDEQEEFDFMKRMLVNAFTAFTHDVKTAPQPSPTAQAAQPDSVQEDAAREAIEKVLALFPFNALIQKFSVNNGPCLTADNDDEFYSVRRVLAFLTEIKTTLDAARKQGATP